MSTLTNFWKMGLLVLLAKVPLAGIAQETTWVVDPAIPGQVIHESASADLRFYEFGVVNPVDGSVDSISFDALTGEWLAIGQDGVVAGGFKIPVSPYSTDPKCVGHPVLTIACAALGARQAVCEARRALSVRRAQRMCAASGLGVSVRSQTGCADVQTQCIPNPISDRSHLKEP